MLSNRVYCNVHDIFRGWSRSSKEMVEHVGNGLKVKIDNEMKKQAGFKTKH